MLNERDLQLIEQLFDRKFDEKFEEKFNQKWDEKMEPFAQSIQQSFKELNDKFDGLIANHEHRIIRLESDVHLIKKVI